MHILSYFASGRRRIRVESEVKGQHGKDEWPVWTQMDFDHSVDEFANCLLSETQLIRKNQLWPARKTLNVPALRYLSVRAWLWIFQLRGNIGREPRVLSAWLIQLCGTFSWVIQIPSLSMFRHCGNIEWRCRAKQRVCLSQFLFLFIGINWTILNLHAEIPRQKVSADVFQEVPLQFRSWYNVFHDPSSELSRSFPSLVVVLSNVWPFNS